MSDMTLLRIGIAIALALLLGAIIFFGRGRKEGQGRLHPPPFLDDFEVVHVTQVQLWLAHCLTSRWPLR